MQDGLKKAQWEDLLGMGSIDTIPADDVVQAFSLSINDPLIPVAGSRDCPENQLPAPVIGKTIFVV